MRPGRLAALAVAVLALGAYIWFVERHKPTTDEIKERAGKVFPDFKQDKAVKVVVVNGHGRFELKKEKDDWKLVAPLTDDANSGVVSSLLSSLANLKADRTLEAKDLKLADYGLEKPAFETTVELEGGGSVALEVGSQLPLGNTRAARRPGDDKVYLVSSWIASDLDRDLAGWRSTELAKVMSSDVASLTVRGEQGRVALAHAGGVWTLTEPFADLADRDRAEGLVGDLNAARIKEFLDTPGDLAALGLAPAKLEVTVVRKDGPLLQLGFGIERDKDGKQVACTRGERVFWVDASALTHAGGGPADWRSKRLVALDTWSADGLAIVAGAAKASVERKDGIWKVGAAEADNPAVSRRLQLLADLEVQHFDLPKPTAAALGTVTVKTSAGGTVEATFYPGGAPGEAAAQVPGRSGYLGVDRVKVDELLANPAALARPKPTPAPTATTAPAAAKAAPAFTPEPN